LNALFYTHDNGAGPVTSEILLSHGNYCYGGFSLGSGVNQPSRRTSEAIETSCPSGFYPLSSRGKLSEHSSQDRTTAFNHFMATPKIIDGRTPAALVEIKLERWIEWNEMADRSGGLSLPVLFAA
jgi:hypothetical protein